MKETQLWQTIQRKIGVRPDGVPGLVTATAVAEQLGIPLADPASSPETLWPRDADAEMRAFYGEIGTGLTQIAPPYPLLYDGKAVKTITVHEKIAAPVLTALTAVLAHYGLDVIKTLRLNRYDGCYNPRRKRGGSTWSVHAYGAALDFDAANNQLKQDHTTALFAKPEYEAWWRAWEAVGAVSLGRQRDFDWMHVQFARLP